MMFGETVKHLSAFFGDTQEKHKGGAVMINLANEIEKVLASDAHPAFKAAAIAGHAHGAADQGDEGALVVKACMNLAADVMEKETSMESCHYILEKAMQQVGKHYLLGRDQQGDPNAPESVRTTEQPAWDGDGLPPVGAVVDVSVGCGLSEHLNRVVIVGHDKVLGRAVYRDMDWSDLEYDSALADAFRPIRTDEEKAVAEMAKAVAEAHDRSDTTGDDYLAAWSIYRDGYRKTEGV